MEGVLIRSIKDADGAFVIDSWRKELKLQIPYRFADLKNYNVGMSAQLLELLAGCKVMIACNPDDEDQIFGWIAYDLDRIHFMYVKEYFRSNGIGKSLLDVAAPEYGKKNHVISYLPRHDPNRKIVDWLKANKLVYKPYKERSE